MRYTIFFAFMLASFIINGCEWVNGSLDEQLTKKMEPFLFSEFQFLEENPFSEEKRVLGERLFEIGCAGACHKKEFGWTSGSHYFPGGVGRGFLEENEIGINVFDNRGFDFPAIKCLGIEGIGFRQDFGASGRFKSAEAQVDSAQAGHRLIEYDTLFTPEISAMIDSAFTGINWRENDTLLWNKIIAFSIGIFERTEFPKLKFYDVPIEFWSTQEKLDALLFLTECVDCHSSKDFSGPPQTIGRPPLPFFPDNCSESGLMEEEYRAVPNLVNVGNHVCWMYDCQEESLEDAVAAHPGVEEREAERIAAFLQEFLTVDYSKASDEREENNIQRVKQSQVNQTETGEGY